jgi:glucose/arabinose dehydrogenase
LRLILALLALIFLRSASAQTLPSNLQAQLVVGALNGPVAAAFFPTDPSRMLVLQVGGRIRLVQNNTLQSTPWLILNSSFSCNWAGSSRTIGFAQQGESGLLGIAFDPNFASNRRFYLHFTDINFDTVLVRLQTQAADPFSVDVSSCELLLRADQHGTNHKGGKIAFGPDGFLYLGLGDGDSGGDPCRRGQILNPADLTQFDALAAGRCGPNASFQTYGPGNTNSRALLAKLLRIDVNSGTPSGHNLCGVPSGVSASYSIPSSNPNIAGQCPEQLSYGLRNPWQYGFDAWTGDLIIGDVGEVDREEINFVRADSINRSPPLNFGWNCFEGDLAFLNPSSLCAGIVEAQTHDPVISIPHSGTPNAGAIVGGTVYRGSISALRGTYLFGDASNSQLFFASPQNLQGAGVTQPDWPFQSTSFSALGVTGFVGLVSFFSDVRGELYFVDFFDGRIFKFTDNDAVFANGFEGF